MTKSLPTLTVICPVYNEEEVLEIFHDSLSRVLNQVSARYTWNILFVMDKSTDRSLEILRTLSKKDGRVKALALSRRFGHQMSLVAGIDHSDSDIIIMMDSDLQHPPELIPQMLDAYEKGNDVVYTIRKDSQELSFLKRFTSRNFYRVMEWLSSVSLGSGEADFRLISRRVALVFKEKIRERNQFLRGLFKWVGYNSCGIEYVPGERAAGSSKYNWSRMLNFASAGIISFSKKPLQFAIIIGLIFALIGLISGVFTLVNFFINRNLPSGWATLSILISIFGGFQLFFLGIMGEYIGAIFDEVKRRPLYLIDEAINLNP